MNTIAVKIKKLSTNVEVPVYATKGSAGFDLIAHRFKEVYASGPSPISKPKDIVDDANLAKSIIIPPHSRVLIGCGFSVQIPEGYQLEIRSRSGNSLKTGMVVANQPGTIDSDYRGEIGVILLNTSEFYAKVSLGDKIAQAVLIKHTTVSFEEVEELEETQRGSQGFGSTG